MSKQVRAASLLWAFVVIAVGFVLAGCCRSQPAVPIDQIAMATVTWFITTRGWKVRKSAVDKQVPARVFKETRQRAGFIFTRARRLLQRNASWGSETDQPTLRARLAAEVDQVEAAIAPLVGTPQARGPLFGGKDTLPQQRQHLDLGPLVTQVRGGYDPPAITVDEALTTTQPERRHGLLLEHVDKRRQRAVAAGWRAAAADDDLWKETGATSQLRVDELHGLVDRRLHAVELTEYRLSSGARAERIGTSSIKRRFLVKKWKGPSLGARIENSFIDDHPHRSIEPPSVPMQLRGDSTGLIHDGAIETLPLPRMKDDLGLSPYLAPSATSTSARPWFLNKSTEELDWNIWPGTQVLPIRKHTLREEDPPGSGNIRETVEPLTPAEQTWQVFESGFPSADGLVRPGYAWVLGKHPDIDPAREIEKLFIPKTEWWMKPWLHADGAFSALHLEALRFGLFRRTGKNDLFNAMAAATTLALEDGFGIRGYAQVPDHPLKRGRTDWFENATVPLDELQVGDQVLVESLFPFLLAGWWEYPTCVVSNIDVDAKTGRVGLDGISVAGFVTAEQPLSSYRKLVIELAQQTLDALRATVDDGAGFSKDWDPGRTFSKREQAQVDTDLLRKWSPYEHPWEKPGPWWVRIHLDNPLWSGLLGDDVESVMLKLPKSVTWIDETHVIVEMSGKIYRFPIIEDEFELPPTLDEIGPDSTELDPHRTIFVPLFEPFGTFSDGSNPVGWWEFLKTPQIRTQLGKKLQPVTADGGWVTGLTGAPNAVRIIRPRPKRA